MIYCSLQDICCSDCMTFRGKCARPDFLRVFIPSRFPGRNDSEDEARTHWSKGAKLKKHYTEIAKLFFQNRRPEKWVTLQSFGVLCVWNCKNDKKDPDNISSGIKYILDGAILAGIIENDRWSNVLRIDHKFKIVEKGEKDGVEVVFYPY